MRKVINAGEVKVGDRILHPGTAKMVEVKELTPTWGNSVVVMFETAPRLIMWRRSPVTLEETS